MYSFPIKVNNITDTITCQKVERPINVELKRSKLTCFLAVNPNHTVFVPINVNAQKLNIVYP